MTNELQDIISGKSQVRYGTTIQAAICYLKASEASSSLDKTDKHFKREETKKLKQYIDAQNLWVKDIDLNKYVSEGAEQKVYLKDSRSVLKLNDAIYYLSWVDIKYCISLIQYSISKHPINFLYSAMQIAARATITGIGIRFFYEEKTKQPV